ncbi:hypothetical protein J7E38_15515 [Bacillus sp. ISL-35]|uniref:hypothetical protein n=1 Tax=Bacillus sp. ISL-35 TaxID=2819122 RepID=UPI001BE551DF|nr:hypothetical protein [Bacillus sp. ISL-35]MBT2680419.1 hypothetical protein [Bacillus sp. ISL-35]MBT2704289.1 hypothetical protein [Chryseobacterium sp. ISL-80]
MEFTAIAVFAMVWGGLIVYFLTPFNERFRLESKMTFPKAFRLGLKRVILHKKAILAFLLLVLTVMSIRSYFLSAEEYDRLHGINREYDSPVFYMISVVMYAALLYLSLAVRWAVKSVK